MYTNAYYVIWNKDVGNWRQRDGSLPVGGDFAGKSHWAQVEISVSVAKDTMTSMHMYMHVSSKSYIMELWRGVGEGGRGSFYEWVIVSIITSCMNQVCSTGCAVSLCFSTLALTPLCTLLGREERREGGGINLRGWGEKSLYSPHLLYKPLLYAILFPLVKN